MDEPDAEAVRRFTTYEAMLFYLAQQDKSGKLDLMCGPNMLNAMRRTAFINAAINLDHKLLTRLNIVYPGVDLNDLAHKLRLQVVISRLDGDSHE